MSKGKKIRLICEGDMDCLNPVFLTKDEVIEYNKESKVICCPDCKPIYGNDIRAMPLPMNDFEDNIDKPPNPEEPV
jgi:hypothetical protein